MKQRNWIAQVAHFRNSAGVMRDRRLRRPLDRGRIHEHMDDIFPTEEPCSVCQGTVAQVVPTPKGRYRADCSDCGEDAELPGYGDSPSLAISAWEEQQRWYSDATPWLDDDSEDLCELD